MWHVTSFQTYPNYPFLEIIDQIFISPASLAGHGDHIPQVNEGGVSGGGKRYTILEPWTAT